MRQAPTWFPVTTVARGIGREQLTWRGNLFEAGANSLSLASIITELSREAGIQIRYKDIFEHPTPAGISKRAEQILAKDVPLAPTMPSEDLSLRVLSLFPKAGAIDAGTKITEPGKLSDLLGKFASTALPEGSLDYEGYRAYLESAVRPDCMNTYSPLFMGHMTSALPWCIGACFSASKTESGTSIDQVFTLMPPSAWSVPVTLALPATVSISVVELVTADPIPTFPCTIRPLVGAVLFPE